MLAAALAMLVVTLIIVRERMAYGTGYGARPSSSGSEPAR
jgi:hypothetical protein